MARDLVRIKIKIGGKVSGKKTVVLLVTESELEGRGLLSIKLDRKKSWELLDLLRRQEFKVAKIETRAEYRAR